MNKNQTNVLAGFLIATVIFGAIGAGTYVFTQTSLLDKFKKGESAQTEAIASDAPTASEESASESMPQNQHPHQAELDKLKEGYLYWDKPTNKYFMKDGTEFPVDEVVFLEDGTPITSGLAEEMQDAEEATQKSAVNIPKLSLIGDEARDALGEMLFIDDKGQVILKFACANSNNDGNVLFAQNLYGSSMNHVPTGFFYTDAKSLPKVVIDGKNIQVDVRNLDINPKNGKRLLNDIKKMTSGKIVTIEGKQYQTPNMAISPESVCITLNQ